MRLAQQIITPADELLCHQTPETFATIAHADISWTEKIWGTMWLADGSLQVNCGLGKYHNRNVLDMFAGISRGTEQMTVRASRRLDSDPDRMGAGPFDYQVLEPLNAVRFTLRENDVIPVTFDLVATGLMPCFLEAKDAQREPHGFRVQSDLLRYHQPVSIRGHVVVDGQRIEFTDETTEGFRDHSWGVRMDVGDPAPDVYKPNRLDQNFKLIWTPMFLRRPDGSCYEIQHYQQVVDDEVTYFSGNVNHPDGTQTPLLGVRDDLKFDPDNRRLVGGSVTFDTGWGGTRTVEVEPASDTGFHLGGALYFGLKGHRHGQWHGEDHLDGERYADTSSRETIEELHQLRDCVTKVREGDATGFATVESMVIGAHPKYGLTKESSIL